MKNLYIKKIETDLILAVTKKIEREGFTVSTPKIIDEDLSFDWWMVNEEEPNEEIR